MCWHFAWLKIIFFYGFGKGNDKTLMNDRLTVTGSLVPNEAPWSEREGASMQSVSDKARTCTQLCRRE